MTPVGRHEVQDRVTVKAEARIDLGPTTEGSRSMMVCSPVAVTAERQMERYVCSREGSDITQSSTSVLINGFGVLFVILNSFGLALGFRSASCWQRPLPIGRLPCGRW